MRTQHHGHFINVALIGAHQFSPGVIESDLAESVSDPEGRERMRTYRSVAIPASSVAAAIAFAMGQHCWCRRRRDHRPSHGRRT
ncbi:MULTISPECIES: hypothetical protein [Streptomyces]|uniref:hypothetical protein n=1 Tax=Streptomyces TaxID=1883 RepID=UPI002258886B|nr:MULTISPECIES: hypothetical protein [Streptomyces]MCX4438134.1 hypothetical protein [Streptomyces mirabilis]